MFLDAPRVVGSMGGGDISDEVVYQLLISVHFSKHTVPKFVVNILNYVSKFGIMGVELAKSTSPICRYFYSFTYLTSVSMYSVPPNEPRMHCDFFWEEG